MVKYYYDKFNAISNTTYGEPPLRFGSNSALVSFLELNKSYSWNVTNGTFALTGGKFSDGETVTTSTNGYKVVNGELQSYTPQYEAKVSISSIDCDRYYRNPADKTEVISYSKGSLVQSNIVAEDGTYPANGHHTDGFWYVRGAVANQNPVITPVGTVPSGSMEVKPSFNYKVTDPDGNTMTVTESIDGIVFNTRTGVVSGTQLTFTLTDLAWLRTRIKQTINITITANDGNGGVSTVNYPITRTTPAIDLGLKTPFETNVAARRLLLKLEGSIPNDANVSVQLCNNAFDTSPTWENATNLVLSGLPHPFTNKTKTATKWGISFKVRIERGGSTQPIYLDGLGGAFD